MCPTKCINYVGTASETTGVNRGPFVHLGRSKFELVRLMKRSASETGLNLSNTRLLSADKPVRKIAVIGCNKNADHVANVTVIDVILASVGLNRPFHR